MTATNVFINYLEEPIISKMLSLLECNVNSSELFSIFFYKRHKMNI